MNIGNIAEVVVPTISALTGLVTALGTLVVARVQLRKLSMEAARTGVSPNTALSRTGELPIVQSELHGLHRPNSNPH